MPSSDIRMHARMLYLETYIHSKALDDPEKSANTYIFIIEFDVREV